MSRVGTQSNLALPSFHHTFGIVDIVLYFEQQQRLQVPYINRSATAKVLQHSALVYFYCCTSPVSLTAARSWRNKPSRIEITPGLHPPPSKVPVMDPYRHRQLLHDRWINRASQRLGDIATLKYGSIREFFRVGHVYTVLLRSFIV